ncbi:TPA: hypothetical protein ACGOY0_000744 [Streptococcus suis]
MKKKFLAVTMLFSLVFPASLVFAESHGDYSSHGDHSEAVVISEMAEGQLIVEQQIEVAAQTEPLYSFEEILDLPNEAFPNATPDEVESIKGMIEATMDYNHSDMKVPLSMVYIDKTAENSDAILSGGGLPYCLDNNGWGYQNFITSDCNIAMAVVSQCVYESIIKNPNLRYCRADLYRNCSPRIGHSPYWHRH